MDIPIPEQYALKKEPRQHRTRQLIEQICDTAVDLINERGILALNTNAIAKQVGVDVSSLYHFFPNKEAILYHVAVSWLADYWSVYERFDDDEKLKALGWREFFSQLLQSWRLPDQNAKHNALQTVWRTYSEFEALESFQLQRHMEFCMRHFKRFGAQGSERLKRDIAGYMFYIEDAVIEVIAEPNSEFGDSFLGLYEKTIFGLLETILPDDV